MSFKNLFKVLLAVSLAVGLGYPLISGQVRPLIVLSGSMEPVMSPGDLALVRETEPFDIRPGDIMAFEDPNGRIDVLFTHRVIVVYEEEEGLAFQTKGDAVIDPDPFTVEENQVNGKVVAQIPYVGYLFHHGQSSLVFLFMVVLPAGMIIFSEVRNISKYSDPVKARRAEREERISERKKNRRETIKYDFKRLSLFIVVAVAFFGFISVPGLRQSGVNIEDRVIESGFLPQSVYYVLEDDYIPRYEVISTNMGEEFQVEEAEILSVSPKMLVPPFWAGVFGDIHSHLPAVLSILVPMLLVVIFLTPLWRKREVRGVQRKSKRGKNSKKALREYILY